MRGALDGHQNLPLGIAGSDSSNLKLGIGAWFAERRLATHVLRRTGVPKFPFLAILDITFLAHER